MAKVLVREVAPCKVLYRDDITGIAWIEDGTTGMGISIHPNIDSSGSIRGMRQKFWGKDRIVKSHGFIYNVDRVVFGWFNPEDEYYKLEHMVADECRCQGCIERRLSKNEH